MDLELIMKRFRIGVPSKFNSFGMHFHRISNGFSMDLQPDFNWILNGAAKPCLVWPWPSLAWPSQGSCAKQIRVQGDMTPPTGGRREGEGRGGLKYMILFGMKSRSLAAFNW